MGDECWTDHERVLLYVYVDDSYVLAFHSCHFTDSCCQGRSHAEVHRRDVEFVNAINDI
jgi:hypothetical protein